MPKAERNRINAQGFTFIARGPWAWGEGENQTVAVKRCRSQLPRTERNGGGKIEVFRCSPNAFVDEYGVIKCDRTWKPKPEKNFIDLVEEIAI